MTKFVKWAMAAVMAVSFSAFAGPMDDEIRERTKPVGKVCVEGEECGAAVAAAAPTGPRSGEEVYQAACFACHGTGAGGAPKLGEAAAWADRIGKGMDELYNSGVNGLAGSAMMAKGGCMNCSDDEVRSAVDYIVENSK